VASLEELPFWTWIRVAASVVGLGSGLIAVVRAVNGASLWHALAQALGWIFVIYMIGFTIYAVVYILKRRRGPLWICGVAVFVLVSGFATFGLAESTSLPVNQVLGGVAIGILCLFGVIVVVERFQSSRRVCPDCAETVKAEACVCKFCGFRFAAPRRVEAVMGDEA
jgi:MFS family permease